MDHRIHQVPLHAFPLPKSQPVDKQQGQANFKDLLADAQTVKVSKHAKERMQERQISINEHVWQRITNKMADAKQKGVTDSLVVMDDAALLVSTKSNTIVTAMNRDEATDRIFTNINGTILLND